MRLLPMLLLLLLFLPLLFLLPASPAIVSLPTAALATAALATCFSRYCCSRYLLLLLLASLAIVFALPDTLEEMGWDQLTGNRQQHFQEVDAAGNMPVRVHHRLENFEL